MSSNYNTLKSLNSLFVTFSHFDIYSDSVPRIKIWDIRFYIVLSCFINFIHFHSPIL